MTDEEKAEEYRIKIVKETPYGIYPETGFSCDEFERAYLDGLVEGRKEICKKILNEIRSHEGIEQLTKFCIAEIIKNIGVEI